MVTEQTLFTWQLAATWTMTGVIWMVQLLIYPGFTHVTEGEFHAVHRRHTERITWVVGPAMIVELSTAVAWFYLHRGWFAAANLCGVLALWGLTAFVSVPLHERLQRGIDTAASANRLVVTNWPRTALWTARAFTLLAFAGS